MSDRAAYFEAVLRRIHARHRESPPNGLDARDVDRWLARRDPALLEEAERETTRWLAILNRLAELAEALIAADLRRLAHWCYAWGYALDPTLTDDPAAQRQVGANLALSAMLHPSLVSALHPDQLDLLVERLTLELAALQVPAPAQLRRLVEAMGLSASRARLPSRPPGAELARVLHPLVWPFNLPRLELIEPITAFRLRCLRLPDAEIAPWLPASGGPWWWIWAGDLGALASWLERKTTHFQPLAREAQAAIVALGERVGPVDPDAEDADRAGARALHEALSELHVALHIEGMTREEALVAAFLAALQGESIEDHARRAGLLPGPDTAWLHAHNLPELLARIAGARHHRGLARALRGVEQLAGIRGAQP